MGNSHYGQYVAALNTADNPGRLAEAFVLYGPSLDPGNLEAQLAGRLESGASVIHAATEAEHCHGGDMSYDSSCTFRGYVNVDGQGHFQRCP